MAKLPVNLILYSLYAASAGLIGGIGWSFYATWKKREASGTAEFHKAIADRVDSHIKIGREAQPERKNWRYDAEVMDWWKQFGSVNLIGKLPPEPTKPAEEDKPPPPKDAGIPIADLVVLESLLLEVNTAAAGAQATSHVVVRYKPGVEVHPPPELVAAAPTPWGGPGDASRPSGGPAAPIPMPAGQGELRQFVHLDETLWPPHNTLRLVEIAPDGQRAYFVREDPAKPSGEWKKEPLDKNELDLPTDLLQALAEGRAANAKGGGNTAAPTAPDAPPQMPVVGEWRDPPDTREVTPGHVHVSRRDYDYIRDNSDKVFNDEVAISSWKSKVGNMEGLRVDRVSPRLQAFGIQPGDVILSINGEKVKNKANAYAVARRQYDGGTRRFSVEVLSGRGTGIETRTVTVPKN